MGHKPTLQKCHEVLLMSKAGCGAPASILFKHVTNEHLIYSINSTIVLIGTLIENQGMDEAVKTLSKQSRG